MAFYVAAGALAVLQFFAENPAARLAVAEEAELLRRRLSANARALWPSGPHLDFEAVLQDVAAANALLARLAPRPAPAAGASAGASAPEAQPQQRYVLSLAWRGNPRAFLKALSLGRALAALTGDVGIDVETRPCGAHSPSATTRRARCRAAAASRARRRDGAAEIEAADDEDDGEFADALPVRRATLQQFYSFLRPALLQLRADEAAAKASASAAAASAAGEPDDATCAICLDAAVDTVSPCAHAYCADCYMRWRATARGCALCRAPLPSERGGTGAWVLAEAEEGDGAPPAPQPATADRLAAWLHALPLASV